MSTPPTKATPFALMNVRCCGRRVRCFSLLVRRRPGEAPLRKLHEAAQEALRLSLTSVKLHRTSWSGLDYSLARSGFPLLLMLVLLLRMLPLLLMIPVVVIAPCLSPSFLFCQTPKIRRLYPELLYYLKPHSFRTRIILPTFV